MKSFTLVALFFCSIIYGQNAPESITDLKIPNSPALTLLDKSFSVTETVSSSALISADLVNIKDNSVEITPYWLFKKKGTLFTAREYYGARKNRNGNFGNNPFHNVKKAALSIAHAPSDSLTTISFGLRANVISVENKSKTHYFEYATKRDDYLQEVPSGGTDTRLQLEIKKGIPLAQATVNLNNEYDKQHKKEMLNYLNNPLLVFDVSLASSLNFPGNKSDTSRLGRYGAWLSSKLCIPLGKEYKDFLNVYGVSRLLYDNTRFDVASDQYVETNFMDIGGKLEFKFSDIGLSCEYLNRNGDDEDYRLVGMIEYKINDNLILNGGYGKNFDVAEGNLVSLFGIKWSFNKETQITYDIQP